MNKKNFIYQENIFYLLLIAIISLAVTFYSGFRGVYPIDSFIIFDSGYKIINNIHPFKDYWSITGPFVDYLQSIFFLILGINWFSYVFHAAFINTLLSGIFFFFLREFGFKKNFSFLYSVCISILAYPTAGTPFVDHHAIFFSIIAACFFILSLKKDKKIFWILSSSFLIVSFLSKQIPSSYLIIFFSLIALLKYFQKKKSNCLFFFYSLVFGVLFFSLFFFINQVSLDSFLTQYIFYPLTIGDERIENFKFNFNNVFLQFKFIYLALFPLIPILFLELKKKIFSDNSLILITVIITVLILIYSQIIMKNQILIFFLIPWCLSLTHIFIQDFRNDKILIFLLILLLSFTTVKYHIRFNENKKFMELENIDLGKAVNAKIIDPSLKGLMWIHKRYADRPEYELSKLIEIKNIISKDLNNKIIISDYQFLPFVTGNKNFTPNKWLDRLSVPREENDYYKKYEKFFMNKLKNQNIVNVYIVDESKLNLFLPLLKNSSCYTSSKINELSLKLEISNCIK